MTQSKYLDAVEAAIEDGCTDAMEGGVPSGEVADRLGLKQESAKEGLKRLADSGELIAVDGVDPETYRPRKSYIRRK